MSSIVSSVLALTLVLCALGTMSLPGHFTVGAPPPTVSSLNVSQYLGVWYQVYQDFIDNATFSNNSFCATATYGIDKKVAGRVTVFNWERQFNVSGPIRSISGYAYQEHPNSEPGQLTVRLYGTPFPAPYWVVKLGPVFEGQYDYSVVSDPLRLTLFVLTRNVTRFNDLYEKEVLRAVKELGFKNFWDKPERLVQKGCTYQE